MLVAMSGASQGYNLSRRRLPRSVRHMQRSSHEGRIRCRLHLQMSTQQHFKRGRCDFSAEGPQRICKMRRAQQGRDRVSGQKSPVYQAQGSPPMIRISLVEVTLSHDATAGPNWGSARAGRSIQEFLLQNFAAAPWWATASRESSSVTGPSWELYQEIAEYGSPASSLRTGSPKSAAASDPHLSAS